MIPASLPLLLPTLLHPRHTKRGAPCWWTSIPLLAVSRVFCAFDLILDFPESSLEMPPGRRPLSRQPLAAIDLSMYFRVGHGALVSPRQMSSRRYERSSRACSGATTSS